MKVALVHDWLNGMRGGEKVFEGLCELFPDADVFTLFHEPDRLSPAIRRMKVHETPWAGRIPGARRRYRHLLPFLPAWAEALPVAAGNYDLVVSTSHCVAKGVLTGGAPHVCYCFTPMRYIWDKFDDYFGARPWRPAALAMRVLRGRLQRWDMASAAPDRVTAFLTSSEYVRERIRRTYGRDARVVAPPVECARFAAPRAVSGEEYFLVVSALEPYKRFDLAVNAFRTLGLPLKVAGKGSQFEALRQGAPANVEFLGWVSDDDLPALYAGARALVFPADEDFGIVPLEAAAAGCPTIAFGHGGSLETVRDGRDGGAATGVFFAEQTVEAVAGAVRAFVEAEAAGSFVEGELRKWAAGFDRPVFLEAMRRAVLEEAGLAART